MKPQRLLNTASSQSICLFCLHRLQSSAGPSTILSRRSFVRSVWPNQHAGQTIPGESFPDPDLPQPLHRPDYTAPRANIPDTPIIRNQSHGSFKERADKHAEMDGSGQSTFTFREPREQSAGSETQPNWGHLRRRRSEAYPNSDTPNKSNYTNIKRISREHPPAQLETNHRRAGYVGLRNLRQGAESSDQLPLDGIGKKEVAGISKAAERILSGEPLIRNVVKAETWSIESAKERKDVFGRTTSSRRTDSSDGGSGDRIVFKKSSGFEALNEVASSNPLPSGRGASRSSFQYNREPPSSEEEDWKYRLVGTRDESKTAQPPQLNWGVNSAGQHSGQEGSRTYNAAQYAGQRASRTYDATPRRRSRDDMDDRRNRRAEKFDLSENAASSENAEAKALKELRKRRRREKAEATMEVHDKKLELPAFISVANLATALKVRVENFVQKLEELGFEDVANDHVLNYENASLVAMEFNYQPTEDRSEVDELKPRSEPTDRSILPQRPPVVTIMGHVDHGKTTLLDFLRKSSVAAQEHGGITQHIGAFSVPLASGKLITFLDTPGHAAFLSMRQRGANVTDIVILVVAADDSVKPQTIEAIKHAKAAKVPIIVAINKVDKDEANVERVKQDLLRHDIEVEDFGGEVQAYPVSGKTGQGVDDLIEAMVTQAEILDMRAEIDGAAEGSVLEATTKKAGRIATVLVRRGTLRPGNVIVAGTTWARIRTLKNEAGIQVPEATPGMPVEVDGLRDQPTAGDEVLEAQTEQKAHSVVAYRNARVEQTQAAIDMDAINENRRLEMEKREREKLEREAAAKLSEDGSEPLQSPTKTPDTKDAAKTELYFIIKADVSGSAEALEGSIAALPLSNHPIHLNILRTGVGAVSEFDIDHASAVPADEGFIVSFNQQVPPQISAEAEKAGVRILDENIIYKVTDGVRAIVESKLPPVITKRVTGEAEVAKVFEINTHRRHFAKVAGCKVRNGIIDKSKKIRVYRGGVGDGGSLVYDGIVSSLKSHKKDVTEMRKGNDCGISLVAWEDFRPGDIFQCYEEKSEPRRLT